MDSDFDSEDDCDITDTHFKVESRPEPRPVVGKRHLNDIKDMLNLDSYQAKLEKKRRKRKAAKARKRNQVASSTDAVQTVASKALGLTKAPEVVTFIDHKKRKKNSEKQEILQQNDENQKFKRKEMTLDDARFSVFKFGVSGMDQKSKEEANKALAISLGAKPEANKFVDYKQLKEDRAAEKEAKRLKEEEWRQSLEGVKGSKSSKNVQKKSKVTKKKKGSKSDFKVGAFDGGMLKLSAKDLKSIKSKK